MQFAPVAQDCQCQPYLHRGVNDYPPVAATETLKKMFVIISIAISLEGLVYIFKAGAEDISLLLYPSLVIITSVLAMVGLGLYQFNIQLPDGLASGDYPVTIQISGMTTDQVMIPIR